MTLRLLPLLLLLVACTGPTEEKPGTTPADGSGSTNTEGPAAQKNMLDERDNWQHPEQLFMMMGPNIKGKVVADLFADDGYFTFKLVDAGARVIAIEHDADKVAALEARKKELGLSDEQLTVRLAPAGEPGLGMAEADVALLTHRYPTIADRGAYLTRLRQGMREPRPLFIIEWQYRETPVGPPLAQRMSTEDIMDELGEWGFSDVGAHSAKMPYQVIMLATDYIEMDEEQYQQMMEGKQVMPL